MNFSKVTFFLSAILLLQACSLLKVSREVLLIKVKNSEFYMSSGVYSLSVCPKYFQFPKSIVGNIRKKEVQFKRYSSIKEEVIEYGPFYKEAITHPPLDFREFEFFRSGSSCSLIGRFPTGFRVDGKMSMTIGSCSSGRVEGSVCKLVREKGYLSLDSIASKLAEHNNAKILEKKYLETIKSHQMHKTVYYNTPPIGNTERRVEFVEHMLFSDFSCNSKLAKANFELLSEMYPKSRERINFFSSYFQKNFTKDKIIESARKLPQYKRAALEALEEISERELLLSLVMAGLDQRTNQSPGNSYSTADIVVLKEFFSREDFREMNNIIFTKMGKITPLLTKANSQHKQNSWLLSEYEDSQVEGFIGFSKQKYFKSVLASWSGEEVKALNRLYFEVISEKLDKAILYAESLN